MFKIEWTAKGLTKTEILTGNTVQTALSAERQHQGDKTGVPQMIGSFPIKGNLLVIDAADRQNCKAIDHGVVRVLSQNGEQIGEYNLGQISPSGSVGFVPLPQGEQRQTA